ncbi:hypothetical protein K2X30_04130 [bacterium]|jgi:hypothetical protein|nr:hypothetical protein [bacterium]
MQLIQILVLLLSVGTSNSQAGSLDRFKGCGNYRVQGTVIQKQKDFYISIFSGSREETQLKVLPENQKSVREFLDQTVDVDAHIPKLIKKYRGVIQVSQIRFGVPNPADPARGDGFWLEKRTRCGS